MAGVREGQLAELFQAAGLRDIESTIEPADLELHDFDAWWAPSRWVSGQRGPTSPAWNRQPGRPPRAFRAMILGEPFTIRARAWAARGVV